MQNFFLALTRLSEDIILPVVYCLIAPQDVAVAGKDDMINRLTGPRERIYHRAIFRSADRAIMAHEIAKLLLEHADTFLERQEAVKTALQLGMPLYEIEEYLDWLDTMKSRSDENDS